MCVHYVVIVIYSSCKTTVSHSLLKLNGIFLSKPFNQLLSLWYLHCNILYIRCIRYTYYFVSTQCNFVVHNQLFGSGRAVML